MRSIHTFFLTLVSVLLVGCTSGQATSAPTPQQGGGARQSEDGPKAYSSVITDSAETDEGIFDVHRIGEDLYYEIPMHRLDELAGLLVGCRGQSRLQALGDVGHHRGVGHGHVPEEDLPRGPVDRDHVPGVQGPAVDAQLAPGGIDVQLVGTDDGAGPHPARHDCRVGGLPTARGEDPGGHHHPLQVVGVGLPAHEDDGGTGLRALHRLGVVEDDLPHRGAG